MRTRHEQHRSGAEGLCRSNRVFAVANPFLPRRRIGTVEVGRPEQDGMDTNAELVGTTRIFSASGGGTVLLFEPFEAPRPDPRSSRLRSGCFGSVPCALRFEHGAASAASGACASTGRTSIPSPAARPADAAKNTGGD